MRRIFSVFVAVVVVSTMLAGVAVASPNNTTTASSTTSVPQTTSGVPDPSGPTSYQGHVGNTVHVVSAEVVDGDWVVVLEADAVERVTIQDPAASMARLSDEGSGNFDPGAESREVTVTQSGRTTVRLEAATYDGGHALYVLANGDGWYTSTGMSSNPFQYFGGMSGLLTGLALSVVVSGGAALYVTYGRDPPVRRAD
jgi:hypothetical protein